MANFSIEFKKSETPKAVIIRFAGYFDDVAGEKFKTALLRYLELGERVFVLNFKQVTIINSPGISVLLEMLDTTTFDHQGKVHLCDLSKTLQDVFRMVGILSTYPFHDTEEQALAGLG
jgi:stage II sporulation protein AA (anti-sigma F factor antagonist)